MRRLDRYVFREMLIPFFTGTIIVALLFQANSYIYLAKNFNLDNIPILARVQWLLYTLPSQLKLTIPTGMALAASLSMGRMGREVEITALRAAGVPVRRLLWPVIVFGAFAGLGNFIVVDRLIPEYGKKSRELAAKNSILGLSRSDKTFKSNAFIQLDKYAASFGSTTRTPDDKLIIQNIMLIERSDSGVDTIVVAPEGTYDAGLWTFRKAHAYAVKGLDIVPMSATEITVNQTQELNAFFSAGSLGLGDGDDSEMPTRDLRLAIETAKKQRSNPRRYEVELQSRLASGVACAVFAFTSGVVSIFFSRSGGFAGLMVSFAVVVSYYNAYVISVDILGHNESVPTWLAAWLPNILFGLLGLIGLRRIE